jgi:hypothetical protein
MSAQVSATVREPSAVWALGLARRPALLAGRAQAIRGASRPVSLSFTPAR